MIRLREGNDYRPRTKDLPPAIRPRERLLKEGAGALNDAELLAILMRTGSLRLNVLDLAGSTLSRFGGLEGVYRAGIKELQVVDGLGEVKAVEIKAAFELGQRLHTIAPEARKKIGSALDLANLLMAQMAFLEEEHLRVVLLNTKNEILAIQEVYKGSLNTSAIRIAEIFKEAIKHASAALILVHNHPSGDPTPSVQDIAVTKEVAQAGKLLDIDVLDHLVIGRQRYVSMKERGIGFE